jgi:asparagine synthase (glutamine-hydrolysing)
MPGIVGLITNRPPEWAKAQLLMMLETLRHEASYVTGSWCDESMGVYAGWVAHQGSFSDGMPLTNEMGNAVLVFSGEEHPELGAAALLREQGHSFNPEGPSYLVHLYEEDPSFPAGLNGWFQGLVVDRARREAILFNDRYGMHRLYYHEARDVFYFSVEAKAILAVRPELREVDPRGLGEFIAVGCVLENRTLFQGIQVLPPASAWSFRGGSVERRASYFQPSEWEQQAPLEPETYYEELRGCFSRNLPRYFNGRQRIGMSLTGGLDTRAIMAWRRPEPGSLPCYTFGGTYRACRDVLVARRVASACGQPHVVIQAGADFLARFPQYAERTVRLTDGGADVSCSPMLYVCQKAREIAPVRITGNYGDQILRRFRAFKPERRPLQALLVPELQDHVQAAKASYDRIAAAHPLSFAAFRQAPWHHHSLQALEHTQLVQRSPFLDNDLVRTNFRAPASAIENNDVRLRLIADGNPALREIRTDVGVGGRHQAFPGAIVRRYQDFTFRAEYAYDHGMPQWVARIDRALSPFHLERLFLGRHKYYHFRVWYRDCLAGYVREMLLDRLTLARPYLNAGAVEAAVQGHLNGGCNNTIEIHKLLSLELFHRLFIDSRPAHLVR